MLRAPGPAKEQNCPICGSRLVAGALYCEACGTDLSRSGALFSTGIRPVSLPRHRKSFKQLRPVAAVAAAIIVLAGLGAVPAVSARVPVLGTLYAHTVGWGLGRLGGPSGVPSQAAQGQGDTTFLLVRSTPSGAQVLVDDRQVGTTPLTIDLRPGTYRVRVSREGYPAVYRTIEVRDVPVTMDVSLLTGELETPESPVSQTPTPAPRPTLPAPPRPAAVRPPLAAGTKAPTLVLKDRFGILHRLETGHKTAVLFVWALDDDARQAIRDLDAQVRKSGGRVAGLVILMQADRVSVRSFISTWGLKIPVLFGTTQAATQYHVTQGADMLYLVSERGAIERVQKGTIRPSTIIR